MGFSHDSAAAPSAVAGVAPPPPGDDDDGPRTPDRAGADSASLKAPDTGRRFKGSRTGKGGEDGGGESDGSSDDIPLEEQRLTDVQFFALEEEGAEMRAAKAQLMALKEEHEANKRKEAAASKKDDGAAGPDAGAGADGDAATAAATRRRHRRWKPTCPLRARPAPWRRPGSGRSCRTIFINCNVDH